MSWKELTVRNLILICCPPPQEKTTEERVQRLKQRFMSAYDVTADGKLQIQEVLLLISLTLCLVISFIDGFKDLSKKMLQCNKKKLLYGNFGGGLFV